MLRTRLLLNLLPFPLILLAVGAYAVVLFVQLAREFDRVVTLNYQTVMASQDMALSLARIQSAVRIGIDSNPEEASIIFKRQLARFENQLERQQGGAKSAHVQTLTAELAVAYDQMRESGTKTLGATERMERRREYDQQFYPATLGVQLVLDELGQAGRRAIFVANESAERILRQVIVLMAVAILAGLLLSGYSVYQFARSILDPIQSLTRATRDLAKGEPTSPVVVQSRDELAVLAGAFNDMATQLQEYRRSTSAEILHLHRTMQATLASFPDPVYVLNPQGDIDLENPAAQALSRGLNAPRALPTELEALVNEARASGIPHLPNDFSQVISLRHNSQEHFYLPRILAMRDERGEHVGVAAVLYDLTRFRLLDAMKTNLVATVSHELKTPLTSVRMAIHLLLEETLGHLTPEQRDMLITARDDAERLLRILNDLLDLARLDEGIAALRRELVEVEPLLREVVGEFAEPIAAAGLTLTQEIAPKLPRVLVDVSRIRHVFANLLTNAIKYSKPGGHIRLRAAGTGDRVEFTVHDDGDGIPPEYHARIFERFYRVPAQSKSGAGLGLSIAREIVVAHGGYLGVRSQPGHGTDFYFTLPSPDGEDSPAHLQNQREAAGGLHLA